MGTALERARGALYGLAIGDALGMPTQMMDPQIVQALFPVMDRFYPGPEQNDMSRGQPAGCVTDDTAQAMILADLLIRHHGRMDSREFVQRLLAWASDAERDGSEQLGPSTRRALELSAQGVPPERSGRYGTTNGAAMRITPLGIAVLPRAAEHFAKLVADTVKPTHFTTLGISGASAVAAAVSAGVSGSSYEGIVDFALSAADCGQRLGYYAPGPNIAQRIMWAIDAVSGQAWDSARHILTDLVGTSVHTQEAVPAAFALWSLSSADPWTVCLHAAALGSDSDTIGAMAGAIAGAYCGVDAFPEDARALVSRVNRLDLDTAARDLLALRHSPR